jgi:hypothetical protein
LLRHVIRPFGQVPQASFDVAFLRFPETENHLFMIESNRVLMNELLVRNPRNLPDIAALRDSLLRAGVELEPERGGQRGFLLRRMQAVLRHGFFEFNARVYQRFTAQALNNLHSFARDSVVALGAACALDYLSTVFALQSLASIRYGPYRRSSEAYLDQRLAARDPLCSFFAVQTGIYPWNPDPSHGFWSRNTSHASTALFSVLLKYRVPEPVRAWMRGHAAEYEVRIRSGAETRSAEAPVSERYAGGPGWLLSAGGRYQSHGGPNFPTLSHWPGRSPWVYDVIARPANLILYPSPRGRLREEKDIIRTRTGWDGDQLALQGRFLYAHAPALSYRGEEWPFAVPNGICPDTAEYESPHFRFRFCDLSASHGIFLVFSKLRTRRGDWLWKRQRHVRGGLEVVPASEAATFRRLIEVTLARHAGTAPGGIRPPVYTDWSGTRLLLNPRYQPGAKGVLRAVEPESRRTPPGESMLWKDPALLSARLLDPRSGGLAQVRDGRLRFRDPVTGGELECDFREWWRPRRHLKMGNPPAGF